LGFAGAAAVAALSASSYPGCAVYDSSLIGSTPDGAAGGDGAVPPCMHAYPPDRPPADAGTATPLAPIVAAFNTIDIGVRGPPDGAIPPFGYDLDHTCTCPGLPSCAQPKGSPLSEACDDSRGRDNIDIKLFQALPGAATTGTAQVDQGLRAGQYGLLIRIRDYDGMPEDPKVTVDFYVSNGLERDDAGNLPTAKFDGTDHWTIDPASFMPSGQPTFSADNAYVARNPEDPAGSSVLVASFDQLPIVFGDRSFLGGATMQLFGAVIVGTLQLTNVDGGSSGSSLGLGLTGGTIAGRWPTSQILSTLATIPAEGGFLCGTDPSFYNRVNYAVLKGVICAAADIAKLSNEDNQMPLAPCDAISVGMKFTAVPAVLGGTFAVAPAPAGCDDGGVLWSDQCPQ
jgi:hypothetical protein